jgi:phosphohistidine phosphatase
MKTLLLVRHAKSSWSHTELADAERPLTRRGIRDAREMAKRLAKDSAKVEAIVSSSAVRALATATIVAKKLGYKPKKISVDARLYAAPVRDLLKVIQTQDDRLRRVMLIGHNPGLSELIQRLSKVVVDLPTGAVATLKFDANSWLGLDKAPLFSVTIEVPLLPALKAQR